MNEGAPTSTVMNLDDAQATIDAVSATPFALLYVLGYLAVGRDPPARGPRARHGPDQPGNLGHGECIRDRRSTAKR